ncbi:MAG TPA: His/Gly/Thr/Pro-type tRNA ligase C-terminal domain-containing protein, partial [Candidatus Polarisedimenticolia bacterium]
TRLIGALVMAHGDDNGVSFPPRLAPTQVVIVPIWKTDAEREKISEAARLAVEELKGAFRVHADLRDEVSPGWKFNEWEIKGVPLRLEIGPKDLEKDQFMAVRRLDRVKVPVPRGGLAARVAELLERIQSDMLEKGRAFLRANTRDAGSYDEFKKALDEVGGFFRAHWCGSPECEKRIKAETKATIRCIPLQGNREDGTCLVCGAPSSAWVYLARAY